MSNDHTTVHASRAAAIAAPRLRTNPRVTMVDVGNEMTKGVHTGEIAVRVHVADKHAGTSAPALESRLGPLFVDKSSIPFERVDIVEGTYPPQERLPNAHFNPLIGGVSTSNQHTRGYGTLGCGVTDHETGRQLALSNWHVYVRTIYSSGSIRAHQPGLGDDWQAPSIGTVARHALWDGYDAAVVALDPDRPVDNEQLGIGPITGLSDPEIGKRVMKSGRGSGVTTGVIDGVNGFWFATVGGLYVTIRDVMSVVSETTSEVSRGGDSGSVWMDLERNALGLHFAGGNEPEIGLAMALRSLLDALHVDLAGVGVPLVGATAEQLI